jgi:hypothetical protein
LARYLVHGKGGVTAPDRVQWVLARNLTTSDPVLAATFMAATASRSPRCKKPCYHLMVAWHEDERPSPEVMQEIAVRVLDLAGLAEHQALVIGHGDTAHRHFHVMLNRVHAETGKAWRTAHDYRQFDWIMAQLAGEYGFQLVPAHAFHPEQTDQLVQMPDSKAYRAALRGAPTGRLKWSKAAARKVGDVLSVDLDHASTAEDVAAVVAQYGLQLTPKGQGYVVGNGESYATLSSLGLLKTAHGYQRRPSAGWAVWRPTRHWWDVDIVDLTRAFMGLGLADREDLKAAIAEVQASRRAQHDTRGETALSRWLQPKTASRKVFQQARVKAVRMIVAQQHAPHRLSRRSGEQTWAKFDLKSRGRAHDPQQRSKKGCAAAQHPRP